MKQLLLWLCVGFIFIYIYMIVYHSFYRQMWFFPTNIHKQAVTCSLHDSLLHDSLLHAFERRCSIFLLSGYLYYLRFNNSIKLINYQATPFTLYFEKFIFSISDLLLKWVIIRYYKFLSTECCSWIMSNLSMSNKCIWNDFVVKNINNR